MKNKNQFHFNKKDKGSLIYQLTKKVYLKIYCFVCYLFLINTDVPAVCMCVHVCFLFLQYFLCIDPPETNIVSFCLSEKCLMHF